MLLACLHMGGGDPWGHSTPLMPSPSVPQPPSLPCRWSALLARLPEEEAQKLQRSMGLKMEQVGYGLARGKEGRSREGGGGALLALGRSCTAPQTRNSPAAAVFTLFCTLTLCWTPLLRPSLAV